MVQCQDPGPDSERSVEIRTILYKMLHYNVVIFKIRIRKQYGNMLFQISLFKEKQCWGNAPQK